MPKIVDHDQRRAEVLEATWRVITTVGLHGATTRRIAQEAGYSNGVLAHYFADKADILTSALQMVHARVRGRMEAAVSRTEGLAAFRAVLLEALPLDEDRLFEANLEFGYLSHAINATRLRDLYQDERIGFNEFLHTLVAAARARDEVRADLDDAHVVAEALVFIDGISAQAVFLPNRMPPELQLDLADTFLARISTTD
ncbi:TetR/AcrR family transcriptional regulator [Nocardioides mangrovicus]|uniref:TetR/AcrR family transcriptional regulator n=1 Tax=Nocardioides mangrovicus TaxID=2478913 RepID=UPI0013148673|nr:TetR/AcrR family transcriptional regulator [Nocardioides mangrovicus]